MANNADPEGTAQDPYEIREQAYEVAAIRTIVLFNTTPNP